MKSLLLVLFGVALGVAGTVVFIRSSGDSTAKSQEVLAQKLSEADKKASAAATELREKMDANR